MYLLKLLIILQLFIIEIFATDKVYPLECYYILNKNYYNRLKNNIKPNESLFKNAVYTGSIFTKVKAIKRSNENYKEEVTKILFNGKTINYDNFFENDPFNVLLNAKTINKNVIAEFTTAFGDELMKKKMNYIDEYKIYNPKSSLTEQEKEIKDMYIYMLTLGETVDVDALLYEELSKYSDIKHSLELDYAISSLENENIVQWILNKANNNPTYSYLYNKYGMGVDTNNFLNVITKYLIYENDSIGDLLNNQNIWQDFKNLIEIFITEYIFSVNMNYYLYDSSTDKINSIFNLLSSDIKSTLYDFYLKAIKYIDKSETSTIDIVLQQLLLSNIEYNITSKEIINISRDKFFNSIKKIIEIYLSTNSLVENIKISKTMKDEYLIEQLLNAHELARISVYDILLKDKDENLETLVQCYDTVIKYSKNLPNDYYNLLIGIANTFIIQHTNFIGDSAYRTGNYDNIISKMIIPYQYNTNIDDDYTKNIITAVTLIKQSLNGMFEMGDDLIYGYERKLCFEINDKNDNKAFITNKLNKDCIFKGARASNEAIYKLVKYYYDIFVINCLDDLEIFDNITPEEFTQYYYNVLYREDTVVQSIVIPTIKLYNDLDYQDINYLFNVINDSHSDDYINEAAKLIKKIGLYMLDNTLITEDLITNENLNYDLSPIEIPPLENRKSNQMDINYLYWSDSVVDKEYNGYFEYQYYSLLYYIEDLEEEVRKDDKLDKIIQDIRSQAKNIIDHYEQYENDFVLLKEAIFKYERMVDILAEYIYQYGYDSIDTDTLLTKYLPDDDFEDGYNRLVNSCVDFEDEYEKIMNKTLIKQLINTHNDIMLTSVDDIHNYSIKSINYNGNENKEVNKTKRSLRILNNKNNSLYGNIYKRQDFGSLVIGGSVGFLHGVSEIVIDHNIDYSHYEGLDKMKLKFISSSINIGVGLFTSFFNSGNLPFNIDSNSVAIGYISSYNIVTRITDYVVEKYFNKPGRGNEIGSIELVIANACSGDSGGNSRRKRNIKYNRFAKRKTSCNQKQIAQNFNFNKETGKSILKEGTSGVSPMSASDAQAINDIMEENKFLSKEFSNAESGSITSNSDDNSESVTSSEDIDKRIAKENTKFDTNFKAASDKNLIKNENGNNNKNKKYRRRRKNKNKRVNNNNRKNSNSMKDRSGKINNLI